MFFRFLISGIFGNFVVGGGILQIQNGNARSVLLETENAFTAHAER